MEAVPRVLNEHLSNPLNIAATSRLHHSPLEATTQGHSGVGPRENRTPAPPVVSSAPAPVTFKTRLANWWPVYAGHAAPPIVDVPLAQAGASKQQDEDLVQDEYFDDGPLSQNPKSQQSAAAGPTNAGE
ncbi:hypothetical protein K503DRAFT_804230 [Rhizopogon vinicolor AM-OR11-026]|uniref:Uncharacterized protein n=1 Tax=Rhizopogon vinicolor AM-OR11-026 TaxID=1314800 RepID=A0A1B7MM09_9AGAM|nr:hypothetical protein K503DRAFT_804230 [Rhizopogon vinicolor AM-OR11-026]